MLPKMGYSLLKKLFSRMSSVICVTMATVGIIVVIFPVPNIHHTLELFIPARIAIDENDTVTPKRNLMAENKKRLNTALKNNYKTLNCSTSQCHVGLLKVHKAGSSTMQNLLFRFSLKHNLTLAIPQRGNQLHSKSNAIRIRNISKFDVFAIHTIYSERLFNSLLPVDSAFIGIVREPFDRLLSAAFYYKDVFKKKYLLNIPQNNFIRNLINFPEKYDTQFYSQTKNTMAQDFGFPRRLNNTDTEKIQTILKMLDKRFDLVLVVDRFDESLVLLKRLMNWSMADILYLKVNTNQHKSLKLNQTEEMKLKTTCFLDYAIYNWFSKIFDRKVREQGNGFQREVTAYRNIVIRVSEYCDSCKDTKCADLVIDRPDLGEMFTVTHNDCELMGLREIDFISRIRKQIKESK